MSREKNRPARFHFLGKSTKNGPVRPVQRGLMSIFLCPSPRSPKSRRGFPFVSLLTTPAQSVILVSAKVDTVTRRREYAILISISESGRLVQDRMEPMRVSPRSVPYLSGRCQTPIRVVPRKLSAFVSWIVPVRGRSFFIPSFPARPQYSYHGKDRDSL